jgi:hypothetical protein
MEVRTLYEVPIHIREIPSVNQYPFIFHVLLLG